MHLVGNLIFEKMHWHKLCRNQVDILIYLLLMVPDNSVLSSGAVGMAMWDWVRGLTLDEGVWFVKTASKHPQSIPLGVEILLMVVHEILCCKTKICISGKMNFSRRRSFSVFHQRMSGCQYNLWPICAINPEWALHCPPPWYYGDFVWERKTLSGYE